MPNRRASLLQCVTGACLLLLVLLAGCSYTGLMPIGGSLLHYSSVPYRTVLLAYPTSDGNITVVRDASSTNRFVVELFNDTLGLLWSTPAPSEPRSPFVPLAIRESAGDVVMVSARNAERDSVVIEAHRFSTSDGARVRVTELIRLGRDKGEKRSPYRMATSPDGDRLLFYALKPKRQDDSTDALIIESVLYHIETDRLVSRTFTYQPLEAVRDKKSSHLVLPIAATSQGTWYAALANDMEYEVEFNPHTFIPPFHSLHCGVSVDDGGRFYTVGRFKDSILQLGCFDPESGKQQTQRIEIEWNPELDDDFSTNEVALIPIARDSVLLFMMLRDGDDVPFSISHGVIGFSLKPKTRLPSILVTDDRFDDHFVQGTLFCRPDRAFLFMRKIYSQPYRSGGRGISWETIYEDITAAMLHDKWIDYREEIEGRSVFPVPVMFDCVPWTRSPVGAANFLMHDRDTLLAARLNPETGEPEIQESLLFTPYVPDPRNIYLRPDNSIVTVIGEEKRARLVRVVRKSE